MLLAIFCVLLLAGVQSFETSPGIKVYAGLSCGYGDCSANITTKFVTLGSCSYMCNPCEGAGACQFQKFTEKQGSTQHYLCGNDSQCASSNCTLFKTYTCGTCANISGTSLSSVKVTCPEERIVGGAISCGFKDCASNVSAALAVINKCYSACNPCNPSQCSYQSFFAEGSNLIQYNYGQNADCDPAFGSQINNYSCGVCKDSFTDFAVNIPCPTTTTDDITKSLNDLVKAAAVAAAINLSPLLPAGTIVSNPTNSQIVSGVLSFALSVNSLGSLTPQQIEDIKKAIIEKIAEQFDILPITRVSVTWAKKRDTDAVNTATVVVLNSNSALMVQMPIMFFAILALFWGLF